MMKLPRPVKGGLVAYLIFFAVVFVSVPASATFSLNKQNAVMPCGMGALGLLVIFLAGHLRHERNQDGRGQLLLRMNDRDPAGPATTGWRRAPTSSTPPARGHSMGEHPGIIVDASKIRKVNADALFTQGFLCVPEPRPGQPSIHKIDHAISTIRLPEHPDQRFHAVEVAHGAAIYVHPVMSPDHAVEIAAMFANAIAAVGFTGTITACADTPGTRPRTGRYAYSSAICSVDAALDNAETPLHFRSVKKNLDRWAVGSSVFKDIVDLLVNWATGHTSGPILAGIHFTMAQCEPHQIAAVLTRCCEDIGWADLLFPTADGDWYVRFTGEGWIVAGTEISSGKDDAGKSLTQLLADMAPLYDYAQMSRVSFGVITPMSVMIQWGIPGPDDIELAAEHKLLKTSVPGIFAVQVLGPGHADLQPVGFWNMTPLSAGRRMFTAANPGDWWASRGHAPAEGFHSLRKANEALLSKWA